MNTQEKHLQSQLDDALADAAGLEVALEAEQKKVAELTEQLQAQSSGVEYAEKYAAHNATRNAKMSKLRLRLKRREDKVLRLNQTIAITAVELSEATDKIAEQAQELVRLRAENAEYYDANISLGSELIDAKIDLKDAADQIASLEAISDELGTGLVKALTEIADLKYTAERERAAYQYLNRPRRYLNGALSAVRSARTLFARGGVR